MKKWATWVGLAVLVLVGLATLAVDVGPTRIRAYLAGEAFHKGRPTRHWREVLRRHGREGGIPVETARQFRGHPAAFPVLRECASDPDPLVRWPAVALLGDSGVRTPEALDILVECLRDEDPQVRLKALSALGRWGAAARPAVPALAERLKDPVAQIVQYADLVLWELDAAVAAEASGWRAFTSSEYGFSVVMPGEPERGEMPLPLGVQGVVHTFAVWHPAGSEEFPPRYMVGVRECPMEVIEGATEQERFDSARDWGLFGLGGKLVSDRSVSQHALTGREQLIEVGDDGLVRNRQFWAGKRFYQVVVASTRQFHNGRAAEHFLDSFRLANATQKPARRWPE